MLYRCLQVVARAIQAIAYPRCLASAVALYCSSLMTVVHVLIGLVLASREQSHLLRFVYQLATPPSLRNHRDEAGRGSIHGLSRPSNCAPPGQPTVGKTAIRATGYTVRLQRYVESCLRAWILYNGKAIFLFMDYRKCIQLSSGYCAGVSGYLVSIKPSILNIALDCVGLLSPGPPTSFRNAQTYSSETIGIFRATRLGLQHSFRARGQCYHSLTKSS